MNYDPQNSEPGTQPSADTKSGWRRWIHFGWIRTPLGILKVAEGIVLLLGLIVMSTIKDAAFLSSIEFFIFVNTTAWIFTVLTIILYILNVYHRLPAIIRSNVVMVVCCALASLSLLICCATVMGKFSAHDGILAAGSFGLIAMFFFIFETVYYIIKYQRDGAVPTQSQPQQELDTPEGGAY